MPLALVQSESFRVKISEIEDFTKRSFVGAGASPPTVGYRMAKRGTEQLSAIVMVNTFKQIRAAFSLLRPEQVRRLADRDLTIGLVASSDRGYAELQRFLMPEGYSRLEEGEQGVHLYRAGDREVPPKVDIVLYEPGLPCPDGSIRHNWNNPESTIHDILHAHDDLSLALARHLPVFRKPAVDRIIMAVAQENALFALATSLPNVVPNLLELPWAFGEFASDTAFLTVNQVRMAFQIAAACGAEVGFSNQKAEVLSIGASAFGWRAIARELAGKIPLGGGLIAKGAIAFAGTFLVGKGLEHYHHAQVPLTAVQREEVYQQGLSRGRTLAESMTK